MATQIRRARFVDVNSLFKINNRPELVTDLEAIYNSLFNLLNCPIGSRFWEPEYGSALKSFLQDPCVPDTAHSIEVSLLQSIMRWEPRIQLDRNNTWVRVRPDRQGYTINIEGTDSITGAPFATQFSAFRQVSMAPDSSIYMPS